MDPSGQWRKCTTLLLHCVVSCSRWLMTRLREFQQTLFMQILISNETNFSLHSIWQVFNIACSREASSGDRVNVSSDRQFADIVSGQHMFPSWYDTFSTVKLHSDNRWRTQMAFSKTVYSFEVEEDTAPG